MNHPSYVIETLGRLKPHLYQEWLLTNGLGGYAASSVVCCNTRVYHGLLVAATLPPVGRIVTMNRMREVVVLDDKHDQPHEFSANQFRHRFFPEGWNYLRRFEIASDQCARWHYEIDGVTITKEVQLLWLKNVVGVRYTIDAPNNRQVELQLLPFVSLRDFHGTRRASDVNFNVKLLGGRRLEIDGGAAPLYIESDGGAFAQEAGWWFEHLYAIEQRRGLGDSEDLFTPGRFTLNTSRDSARQITVWASLSDPVLHDWEAELSTRRDAIDAVCSMRENIDAPVDPSGKTLSSPADCDVTITPAVRKLARAANDFIVKRRNPDGRDGTSVIAGYPWFADWGRDTFISLPGLLLTTRRFSQARQTLTVFGKHVSEGMIPNRFDDYTNEPHYNTVDASLWYIHAAFEYVRLTKDEATFNAELLPACRKIIDGYKRGTRFGIRMDEADGLITQGDENTQLTWMDAKHEDIAFTPRQGKPVEINALWYHALRLMGDDALARRVADSFVKAFWINPYRGCADVIKPDGEQDRALRPNQIFAVSLPNSPLKAEQQLAVVEVVRRELLTPYGLRTLSRDDPNYHARYLGPPAERDNVYHNGIVWPWLIGAFLDAHLRVNHHSSEAVEQAKQWLQPLIDFLDGGMCVGQLPEIFEAETPQEPVGCFAQAWSVAEVLRLAVALGM